MYKQTTALCIALISVFSFAMERNYYFFLHVKNFPIALNTVSNESNQHVRVSYVPLHKAPEHDFSVHAQMFYFKCDQLGNPISTPIHVINPRGVSGALDFHIPGHTLCYTNGVQERVIKLKVENLMYSEQIKYIVIRRLLDAKNNCRYLTRWSDSSNSRETLFKEEELEPGLYQTSINLHVLNAEVATRLEIITRKRN